MIENNFLVDTRYLRDHVLKLYEEKKLANQIYDKVSVMRNIDDPAVSQKYNSILYETRQLIDYFQKMIDTLNQIEQETIRLSNSIKFNIEGNTETVRDATSKSFLT